MRTNPRVWLVFPPRDTGYTPAPKSMAVDQIATSTVTSPCKDGVQGVGLTSGSYYIHMRVSSIVLTQFYLYHMWSPRFVVGPY